MHLVAVDAKLNMSDGFAWVKLKGYRSATKTEIRHSGGKSVSGRETSHNQ